MKRKSRVYIDSCKNMLLFFCNTLLALHRICYVHHQPCGNEPGHGYIYTFKAGFLKHRRLERTCNTGWESPKLGLSSTFSGKMKEQRQGQVSPKRPCSESRPFSTIGGFKKKPWLLIEWQLDAFRVRCAVSSK